MVPQPQAPPQQLFQQMLQQPCADARAQPVNPPQPLPQHNLEVIAMQPLSKKLTEILDQLHSLMENHLYREQSDTPECQSLLQNIVDFTQRCQHPVHENQPNNWPRPQVPPPEISVESLLHVPVTHCWRAARVSCQVLFGLHQYVTCMSCQVLCHSAYHSTY